MKTYTRTVISESGYKHIHHLHTNIYRVMVRESEQDGMLTVATAKYDHEPTEDEIVADYNASVEAVNRMALQQAQRQKIREIDAYNDSDSVNGFYINGAKVWVDAETRVKGVNGAKAKQTLGATTMSQWLGGQEFTLSPGMAVMLYAQIESYALDCQNVTEAHKSAILALNTVEEVEAYDITQGYPEMLSFTI